MHSCCLYYTAHRHDPAIEAACRTQLDAARRDIPLVAVGLQPFQYGDITVVLPLWPGPLTLHRQILAGLHAITDASIVFFTENDILYHPSHFVYGPDPELGPNGIAYNTNVWRVRYADGHAVWTDDLEQTSGLVGDWWALHEYYERRCAEIERDGFNRHYEPGPKTGIRRVIDWRSEHPNLDIRHEANMTRSKWSPDEFRNARYAAGWREADEVPGWGETAPIMEAIREGRYGTI